MDQQTVRTADRAYKLDALRRTRLLADLPGEIVDRLCAASRVLAFHDGESILRQDEPGIGLIVIASGCVVTSRTRTNGRRLVFDLGQPGQIMGTFEAFDGQPSPLDNHARGETRIVLIPYEVFRTVARRCPDLAIAMITLHTRRNRLDFERMMLVLDSMRVRIAKILVYFSRGPESTAGEMALPVRISQDDIAGILGITRASANKELVALARAGILAWHYSHVTVRDMQKLIAVAAEQEPLSKDFERGMFGRSPKHFRTAD